MRRLLTTTLIPLCLACIFGSCNSSLKLTNGSFYIKKERVKVDEDNKEAKPNTEQSVGHVPSLKQTGITKNRTLIQNPFRI